MDITHEILEQVAEDDERPLRVIYDDPYEYWMDTGKYDYRRIF